MHTLTGERNRAQKLLFCVQWDHCLVCFSSSLSFYHTHTHTHKHTHTNTHTVAALHWSAAPYLKHTLRTQKHTFQVFNGAYVMCVSEISLCTPARRKARITLRPVWLYSVCFCVSFFFSSKHTFSVSSFLTDLRLARRSMETLCLEPSSERRMASADTRTRRRLGLLNFPLRSSTFMFRSLIWIGGKRRRRTIRISTTFSWGTVLPRRGWKWCEGVRTFTSRVLSITLASMSYRSSSTTSTLAWSSLQRSYTYARMNRAHENFDLECTLQLYSVYVCSLGPSVIKT